MFVKKKLGSINKEEIFFKLSDSLVKKFLVISKENNKIFREKEKISICFPGYPFFNEDTLNSGTSDNIIENKKFYLTNIELYGKKFLKRNKICLVYKNSKKKEKKNPYWLYNYNMYMEINFSHLKNNFTSYIKKNENLTIHTQLKNISNKNLIKKNKKNFAKEYRLEYLPNKKLSIFFLFTSLLIFLFIKFIGLFKMTLNFLIGLMTVKIILFFTKSWNLIEKKLYVESYFQINLKKLLYSLFIFCNSIIRSSNLFSV
jgi:hypothetical protein